VKLLPTGVNAREPGCTC